MVIVFFGFCLTKKGYFNMEKQKVYASNCNWLEKSMYMQEQSAKRKLLISGYPKSTWCSSPRAFCLQISLRPSPGKSYSHSGLFRASTSHLLGSASFSAKSLPKWLDWVRRTAVSCLRVSCSATLIRCRLQSFPAWQFRKREKSYFGTPKIARKQWLRGKPNRLEIREIAQAWAQSNNYRGISYTLFFAIFGNLVRWSYGYSLLSKHEDDDEEEDDSTTIGQITPPTYGALNVSNNNDIEQARPSGMPDRRYSSMTLAAQPDDNSSATTPINETTTLLLPKLDVVEQQPGLLRRIARKINSFMSPPLYAACLALLVGLSPLKHLLYDKQWLLYPCLTKGIETCGKAAVPIILTCLGAQLTCIWQSQQPTSPTIKKPVNTVMLVRFVLMPFFVVPIVVAFVRFGSQWSTLATDPVFAIMMIVLGCSPTAINLVQITQVNGIFEEEMLRMLFYSYGVVCVPLCTLLVFIGLNTVDKLLWNPISFHLIHTNSFPPNRFLPCNHLSAYTFLVHTHHEYSIRFGSCLYSFNNAWTHVLRCCIVVKRNVIHALTINLLCICFFFPQKNSFFAPSLFCFMCVTSVKTLDGLRFFYAETLLHRETGKREAAGPMSKGQGQTHGFLFVTIVTKIYAIGHAT